MTTDETGHEPVIAEEPEEPRPEVGVAFTPRQILGGFVLLAALILFLRRRRTQSARIADD
jgi:MYXO-CTERM domain-containing protein